jgi:hypothetical protein
MKTILAVFCLLFVLRVAMADPYGIAIQQARRDSAQNDAEQQRIQNADGGAAQTATGQQPAATSPALAATMQNITNLQVDLAAFIGSAADHPDPSLKVALMNDLSAAAQGTKASTESVKELAKDLFTATAGDKKLLAKKLQLAREIHAVFNSSHLTPTQQQSIYDNVQKTLGDADVPLDAAVDVVTDLKAIVAETK